MRFPRSLSFPTWWSAVSDRVTKEMALRRELVRVSALGTASIPPIPCRRKTWLHWTDSEMNR
jgi:hypothetical protein